MALEQAGVQFIAAGGDIYITTLNSATKATNTFVDATSSGSSKVSGAGQIMIGALREVGKIATQAFLEAGKAAISFVKDSISVAGDFEAGMHKFQAVAGDAVDTKGLEKFKDLFISLGKELPVSTSEVEQAAIEMVSGGIDPAIVAAGALRSTIQFAAASGLSLADAAATSAKFLAGWTSASATTAEKVDFLTSSTDALTKAAAASSTTAAELRLGIFNVQGAAQALHAPFEDVVATLAELAPAFESSAQAGTALNVFMTRLEPATKSAASTMEALGIITAEGQNTFFDAQGTFLGMGNAAQVLKEHLGGLSDQEKISTLHTLFGNDAMKVGNLLMIDGAAGLDAMKAKMEAANGVSATAALMQSGYNTALENAKGSVEALQITIGSALLPVLTDLMNNVLAPGVNILTDFASNGKVTDETFNKLSPTMQQVATVAQQVFDSLKDGIAVAEDIVKQGQELIGTFQQVSGQSSTLSGVLKDLNGVWDVALKTVTDVGNGYLAIANAVLPIVQKLWTDHGAEISAFVKTTYDSVIQSVTLALQTYDAIVPPILNAIAGFFRDNASQVELVMTGLGQALGAIVTGALETIKNLFKLALDLIHGNWSAAWDDIKAIGQAQITAIQGAITGFLDMIAGLFNTSLADIARTWEDNWASLVSIVQRIDWLALGSSVVQGIIHGVESMSGSLFSSLEQMAQNAYNAFMKKIQGGSPAQAFVPAGTSIIQGITLGLQTASPNMLQGMRDIGSQVINSFNESDFIDGLIGAGEDAMKGLTEGMRDGMRGAVRYIESTADTLVGAVEDAFGAHSPATEFMPVGSFAVQGIMAGFENMWPSLMSLVTDLGGNLTDQAQSIAESVQSAMADAFGATASIDRQKVSNLKAVEGLSEKNQAGIQAQLNAVEQEALAMTDPQQAKEWFALRSKQMIELAKLNDQIQATTDAKARERLIAQYQLINAADTADISQFQAKSQSGGGMQDIINSINKLMQDTGLGIVQSPVLAQLAQLLDRLASPAASGAQMSGGNTTVYNSTTNNSMPVYSNNTAGALQQSWAVMQAGMI